MPVDVDAVDLSFSFQVSSSLSALQVGCLVLKAGRNGSISEKFIRLSEDHRYVIWESDLLFIRKVDLKSVVSLVHGQETQNFQPHRDKLCFACGNSFSLVCSNRTYDFIVPNKVDFRNWFYGLQQLLDNKGTLSRREHMARQMLKNMNKEPLSKNAERKQKKQKNTELKIL
mmetsp:Transcript_19890/g.28592  ORF Transcript_19890/g.28592 Transcript_19890/m.28592 type:complete len:171 (+) Transcript_19890:89-601(+)